MVAGITGAPKHILFIYNILLHLHTHIPPHGQYLVETVGVSLTLNKNVDKKHLDTGQSQPRREDIYFVIT